MSDQVNFVDRFQVQDGKLDDFKRFASEMAEFVKENEPGTTSFNYYIDKDGATGTAISVFSNAEALDLHLGLASSRFQGGYDLMSATEIELLGSPNEAATEMAASFNASLKTKLAGFSR